jgi:1-acyl-sn-glycerol-3-phosphate acyltransferase
MKCFVGTIGHLLFFGLLIGFMIPGFLLYFIFKPFISDAQHFFQRGAALSYKLFYILVPCMKLKVDILKDMPKGAIYISTHQSILDFPAFAQYVQNYLIFANVNLGKYPIVEKITYAVGVRYIKGRPMDEISEIYKEMEAHLQEGKNVIYFPEGTRHTGGQLLPFKRGAFRLAMKQNRPIVPIVIEGVQQYLPRKAWCFRTSKWQNVYMKMLPPLYPKDFENEIEMRSYAYKIMQEEKRRLCELY